MRHTCTAFISFLSIPPLFSILPPPLFTPLAFYLLFLFSISFFYSLSFTTLSLLSPFNLPFFLLSTQFTPFYPHCQLYPFHFFLFLLSPNSSRVSTLPLPFYFLGLLSPLSFKHFYLLPPFISASFLHSFPCIPPPFYISRFLPLFSLSLLSIFTNPLYFTSSPYLIYTHLLFISNALQRQIFKFRIVKRAHP
jgi:hypothetical protein